MYYSYGNAGFPLKDTHLCNIQMLLDFGAKLHKKNNKTALTVALSANNANTEALEELLIHHSYITPIHPNWEFLLLAQQSVSNDKSPHKQLFDRFIENKKIAHEVEELEKITSMNSKNSVKKTIL